MYKNRNILLLFLAALIWGTAFVAQSVSMDYVGPFTFNAARFLIGCIVLLPFVIKQTPKGKALFDKQTVIVGLACSVMLFTASSLQQVGIQYTSVGKAGFLTSLYIIIVPFLNKLCFKQNLPKTIGIALVLATIGLYLLSINEALTIELGDILEILGAVFFALHILIIDHYAENLNGVKVSCIQFFGVSVFSLIAAIISNEVITLHSIVSAYFPILYTGIFSCGVAYTLQIIGQKGVNPTLASLILSLESTIAVIAAFIILHQTLSIRELIGCLFVFSSIILAQLPSKQKGDA